jgi:hypothetical protein
MPAGETGLDWRRPDEGMTLEFGCPLAPNLYRSVEHFSQLTRPSSSEQHE